jgi:hypothetical protein
MSSAILDIQCILSADNKYLIKELSITGIESMATQHYIFKHYDNSQNAKSRSVNKWLERNYHGLSIEYGDIEYKEINKILNSFTFDSIYVKGEQKQSIIKNFIPHINVVNLEDLDCPRQAELCEDNLPCCIFHKDKHYTQCTFYKIFVLKKWFNNNI